MWFEDEVLNPRTKKSFLWTLLFQEIYLATLFLLLRILSWNPFSAVSEWLFYLFHWKALICHAILAASTVVFGVLNTYFSSVENHVSSTRFEKIRQSFSPLRIQHFLVAPILGGLISFSLISLFHYIDPNHSSMLSFCFVLNLTFEKLFVVLHGCYTAVMFSLKYFICDSYLLKINLEQEPKFQCVKKVMISSLKESIFCVLKAMIWYYGIIFIVLGPFLHPYIWSENVSFYESVLIHLINYKLFLVTFITGLVIYINWSLCLCFYNTFITERYVFPIEVTAKNYKDKSLPVVLTSSQTHVLKYLSVLDLRLLSQFDQERRKQIFSISHPGGHSHYWNAISEFCIKSLKDFNQTLNEYSLASTKKFNTMEKNKVLERTFMKTSDLNMNNKYDNAVVNSSEKIWLYMREKPIVAYFLDELPSTKIRKLFVSSGPLIWIAEALGFLVSASYHEDKFGVVQQTLPQIIRLLLDVKMAEEKLPIDSVGIKMHVKDPQGRYEHLHQRISLKIAVNNSLCGIADAFKNDISGIYLPDEYHRYFQRYLNKKVI